MAKPTPNKRFKDALSLLASLESVAVAEDKNVSVDAPVQKDNKEDLTDAPIPCEEVDASVSNTPTKELRDTTQSGQAQTQDVTKVTAKQTTDQANAEEVDSVSNKTPDQVKAGEKDLTTGLVSNEDSIEANEAEHIAPKEADDAVMNVEQAVETLEATGVTAGSDAALNRAERVGNDLENISKVEAALEEFQGMLRDMRKKGQKPTPQLARAIQVCLKSHDRSFFRPVIASLEDFARPDASAAVSISLEASIGSKMGELAAAGKNALGRLFEMLMDAWNHMRRDTVKLIGDLDGVIKSIQSADLEAGKDVNVKGATRLMINGEFVGDSVEAVKNVEAVSRELLVEWPQALTKLINDVKGTQQQVSTGKDGERGGDNAGAIEESAQSALEATFHKFSQVDSGEAPSGLSNYSIVTRSPILPGNKALFIGIQDGTNASENVSAGKAFMKFAFESTGDRDGATASVRVPSKERAIASLNAVKGIIANLIAKDTSLSNLKQLRGTLSKSAQGSDVAQGAVQAALTQHRMFMGYLTSLIKAYIAFYGEIAGTGASREVAVRENSAAAKTDGTTKNREDDSVVSEQ